MGEEFHRLYQPRGVPQVMQLSARRTPKLPGQLPSGDEAGPGHLPLVGARVPAPCSRPPSDYLQPHMQPGGRTLSDQEATLDTGTVVDFSRGLEAGVT